MLKLLTDLKALYYTYLIWKTLPTSYEEKAENAKKIFNTKIKNRERSNMFAHYCPLCEFVSQQVGGTPYKWQVDMTAAKCSKCLLRDLWQGKDYYTAPCEKDFKSPYSKWRKCCQSMKCSYDAQFFALLIAEEAYAKYLKLKKEKDIQRT